MSFGIEVDRISSWADVWLVLNVSSAILYCILALTVSQCRSARFCLTLDHISELKDDASK